LISEVSLDGYVAQFMWMSAYSVGIGLVYDSSCNSSTSRIMLDRQKGKGEGRNIAF